MFSFPLRWWGMWSYSPVLLCLSRVLKFSSSRFCMFLVKCIVTLFLSMFPSFLLVNWGFLYPPHWLLSRIISVPYWALLTTWIDFTIMSWLSHMVSFNLHIEVAWGLLESGCGGAASTVWVISEALGFLAHWDLNGNTSLFPANKVLALVLKCINISIYHIKKVSFSPLIGKGLGFYHKCFRHL